MFSIFFSSEIKPWDEPGWLFPIVLTLLIFIEVVGPTFIWAFCAKMSGYLRITSLVYSVLSWLYIPFLFACSATKCGAYSDTLAYVIVVVFVSLPIMFVFILIECWKSRERQYIVKLGQTETVSKSVQVKACSHQAKVGTKAKNIKEEAKKVKE